MATVKPITGRSAGELCRLLEERGFSQDEFQKHLVENPDGLIRWARGEEEPKLLEHKGVVSAPACSMKLAELLQEEKIGGRKVWNSSNMAGLLEKLAGKTGDAEEKVVEAPEAVLNYWWLKEGSVDGPILRELGEKARIGLAHWLWLIRQQADGKEGILLTNGRATIAYLEEFPDSAMLCHWYRDGREWSLNAYPVTYPYEWSMGHQVLSG